MSILKCNKMLSGGDTELRDCNRVHLLPNISFLLLSLLLLSFTYLDEESAAMIKRQNVCLTIALLWLCGCVIQA